MTPTPPPLKPLPTAADTRRRLRSFGLTVGIALVVLAALLLWRDRPAWPYVAGAGVVLALLGLVVPAVLAPIEKVWMTAARAMGWVMTRVILAVVFFVLFTAVGLILRLVSRDHLELRFPGAQADQSYWHPRRGQDRSPERMEKMF